MSMLKSVFFIFAILLGTQAGALTPSQVRTAYRSCVKFLKLNHKQQLKVIRNSPYSLEETQWGCRTMVHNGLAKSLKYEREYQRCQNGGCQTSSDSGGGGDDTRSCSSSIQCSGSSQNCLNGTCQEVNGANHCDAGGLSCTPGETCTNGVCH